MYARGMSTREITGHLHELYGIDASPDLISSVFEWCADGWEGDYSLPRTQHPHRSTDGTYRVVRGGSWLSGPSYLRSANRNGGGPDYRNSYLGFRPAGTLTP